MVLMLYVILLLVLLMCAHNIYIYIYIYIYTHISWVRMRVRVRSGVRETRVRERTAFGLRSVTTYARSGCSDTTYARSGAFGYKLSGFATVLSQPTSLLPIAVAGGCLGCFLQSLAAKPGCKAWLQGLDARPGCK